VTIFWVSYGALWLVVAVQGFAFLEAIRHIGLLREQVGPYEGARLVPGKIEMGLPLPELTAVAADEPRDAAWGDYLQAPLGMVLFLSTRCGTCRSVADGLGALAREYDGEASLVAVVQGPVEEVEAFVSATGLPPDLVAIDEAGETSKRLDIRWTPAALSIRGDMLGTAAAVSDIYQVDAFVSEELAKATAGNGRSAR
jgi:thiol-disulfide isomerase/thioredoxin